MTVHRIRELRSSISPDVMFLMETKNQDSYVSHIFDSLKYQYKFTIPPLGLSGGLALFWKDEVELEILSSSPHFIDTKISSYGKLTSFVTFIYGEPQQENRGQFWDHISLLGAGRDDAWLLTGDLNDILDNSEKRGGPKRCEGSFINFRCFVNQNGLWNVKHSGNAMSWRGTRHTHFIKERLDRSLANCSWNETFPAGRCHYLRFEGSDHRPLVTYSDSTKVKRKGLFRFDRRLLQNEKIRSLVESNWHHCRMEPIEDKIKRCRTAIIQWTKESNQNSKKKIKGLQDSLENLLSAAKPLTVQIASTSKELEKAYKEEELFWRQRSRIQWLQHGDKNTGFFHAVTRGRRQQNRINIIENDQGLAVQEEGQIGAAIAEYFQDIFTTNGASDFQVVTEALSPSISIQENEKLIATPTMEEIKAAVFSIHPDKAPGPDGFSASFYHGYWDIIGADVTREIRLFFETCSLSQNQNATHVCLVPKIIAPKRVGDYRPIALCNVYYKIIAKIITKRLQPLLAHIVSPHQSAFVPGRAISDNVMITHEILHTMRISGATKRCPMAVKTDMSKAYDRIEWGFLRTVLLRLGFHEKWIGWVMTCVSSVHYSFLVNGHPKGTVTPSRGLRQGDPLSPYLFILCTEVLSGLCKKAQMKGLLPGVKVARRCPPINHLLFADDTMFFLKTNGQGSAVLMQILKKYEAASGQTINKSKSSVTFSSKTPPETKNRIKQILGIRTEGGTGKYLGLPEFFGRRKKDIFTSLVDRIRQRAGKWSSRFLSGAGKQILLKVVLSAMPSYAMSCFKLPKSMYKRLQAALTRFWWDDKPDKRKMCWVSWDKLTLPKNAGGLGFRDLESFNDALLAKLSWRLLKNPNSLLAQILIGKYCKESSFMNALAPSVCSHGWKSILAGKEVLKKGMGWLVGDGSKISLWYDPWLSTNSPTLPFGPPTEASANLCVEALIHSHSNSWNLEAIRTHLPHHEDQIRRLVLSSKKTVDSYVWLPVKSGKYSTKSGYAINKLQPNLDTEVNFKWQTNLWQVRASSKIKTFLWKAVAGALPVGSSLARRGITVDLKCKVCGEDEDALHVLVNCPFAAKVWNLAPVTHKQGISSTNSMMNLLLEARKMITLPPSGITTTPLYPWIFWFLWKTRNQRIFNDRRFSEEETLIKAITEARSWQEAQQLLPTQKSPPLSPGEAPSSSVPCCCVDAAWSASSEIGGWGWICRDPMGLVLLHESSGQRHIASALIAEASGLRSAMASALTAGIFTIQFCSDSNLLISLIQSGEDANELKGILDDIRSLIPQFTSISFLFISRSLNVEADALAKLALSSFSLSVTESDSAFF